MTKTLAKTCWSICRDSSSWCLIPTRLGAGQSQCFATKCFSMSLSGFAVPVLGPVLSVLALFCLFCCFEGGLFSWFVTHAQDWSRCFGAAQRWVQAIFRGTQNLRKGPQILQHPWPCLQPVQLQLVNLWVCHRLRLQVSKLPTRLNVTALVNCCQLAEIHWMVTECSRCHACFSAFHLWNCRRHETCLFSLWNLIFSTAWRCHCSSNPPTR